MKIDAKIEIQGYPLEDNAANGEDMLRMYQAPARESEYRPAFHP